MTNSKQQSGTTREAKVTSTEVRKAVDQIKREVQPYFRKGGRLSPPAPARKSK